ncbi:MAG: sigma-70 family RNA polymerase sigma factor [Gemmatimonadota bacterium]|nr:sigma-70 family RNA polymerase sigma factor [Gemmatimonadota bacterium]
MKSKPDKFRRMQRDGVIETQDDHILGKVARGEPGAVRACVDQYGALVWSLALKRTRTRDEAEDAVQEIFLDLWRSAERYNPSLSTEAGFVALIARRRLIDMARKTARRPELTSMPEGLESATDDHVRLQTRVEASEVLEVVRSLPEKQQQMIQLSIIDGLSHSQISDRTGIPLGTVKSNIRRGIAEVRRRMVGDFVAQGGAA